MNLENFWQLFSKKEGIPPQKYSPIKEQSIKMSILVQFKKKIYFWYENEKTGLNGQIKYPKFGGKKICFCLPYCHNVEGKPKWSQKSSHNVSGHNVENKSKWRRL